ncbi:MAG: electron transport complex protein RnfA [Dehalococcoidia bacterium]|nr:Electron transport complex subunit RsxA [Chloroflexota bacterium]MBT9159797.1 Electron transport complex subunit RsxA [Chloroflexota bacterium]MBT9162842.1 Electron transport complex subunit RsxA [Chloroflexota bacterium]
MNELILIFVSMVVVNNFILARFLGLCPFFGVSKKLGDALSMGVAVTLVMLLASVATWFINHYVLIPFGVEFMQVVVYILVIASLVQMVEIAIKRTNLTLYNALGIYLPLITTNCAILGATFIIAVEGYTLLEGVVTALGGGIGFTLVLLIMSGIREKLELSDLPRSMRGLPIALIIGGLLGLAFLGFGGIV